MGWVGGWVVVVGGWWVGEGGRYPAGLGGGAYSVSDCPWHANVNWASLTYQAPPATLRAYACMHIDMGTGIGIDVDVDIEVEVAVYS